MKRAIVILLVLVMVLSLAACAGSKTTSGDFIGVWSGSYEWEGDNYNKSIEFERDGTYSSVLYKNNSLVKTEKGTYTIDGSKVVLKDNSGGSTTYKYSDGKLTNNGHSFAKEK